MVFVLGHVLGQKNKIQNQSFNSFPTAPCVTKQGNGSWFIHTIFESNSQLQITVIGSKFSVLPKFEEFGQIFPFWPAQKLSYAISCFRSAILTHLLIKDFSNVNFFEIFLVWKKTILVQKKKKNCGSYFHEAKKVIANTKFPTFDGKIIF